MPLSVPLRTPNCRDQAQRWTYTRRCFRTVSSPGITIGWFCRMSQGCSFMRRLSSLFLVSGLFAWPALADPLTGQELRQMIIGHTWAWKSAKFATSGLVTYYRDGRMFLTMEGSRTQGGRWRINGSELCTRLIGNSENCFKDVVRIDRKTLFFVLSKTTYELAE